MGRLGDAVEAKHGIPSVAAHCWGALGEYAVCRAFGLEDPASGCDPDGDLLEGLQIRHTPRARGRLIVQANDPDDHVYLLTRGQPPTIEIVGWIRGVNAKQATYWDEDVPLPAFFVPDSDLNPNVEVVIGPWS